MLEDGPGEAELGKVAGLNIKQPGRFEQDTAV